MSRYVDKPHGLTIGSGNTFFVIDEHHEEGVPRLRDGYSAIVSFRGYHFDSASIANCHIETPAEQLCWDRRLRETIHTIGDITFPVHDTYCTLSEHTVWWLNREIGEKLVNWDTYTQAQMSSRNVFFKRRKDALAFCNMIADVLRGVKIGEW